MSKPHPEPLLLDCRGIMGELGITRRMAEAIMRDLKKVRLGERRMYVYRRDVMAHVKQREVA